MSLKLAVHFIIGALSLIILGVVTKTIVQAQNPLTFATTKDISDSSAVAGDILSLTADKKLARSTKSFDVLMYGVLTDTATIIYHPVEKAENKPIISNGEAFVNVTTLGGSIIPGDLITSSVIPGKGFKTTSGAGWVLGVALDSFKEEEGIKSTYEGRTIWEGKIRMSIKIGPGSEASAGIVTKLVDQLGSLVFKNIETPSRTEKLFRYIIAALVALAAIAMGFGSFGKNITRGIEAIGRNPLAKAQIQAMIVLNVFLIAMISLAGIALAFAIIRF